MVTLNKNNHAWIAQALGSITMSGEQEKREDVTVSQTAGSGNGVPMWTKSATLRPTIAPLPAVAVAASNFTEAQQEEYVGRLEDLKRRCDNLCTSLGSMFLNLERTQPNSSIPDGIKQGLVSAQERIPDLGQQGRSTFSATPR